MRFVSQLESGTSSIELRSRALVPDGLWPAVTNRLSVISYIVWISYVCVPVVIRVFMFLAIVSSVLKRWVSVDTLTLATQSVASVASISTTEVRDIQAPWITEKSEHVTRGEHDARPFV